VISTSCRGSHDDLVEGDRLRLELLDAEALLIVNAGDVGVGGAVDDVGRVRLVRGTDPRA
jgi:hypothetical protein